MRFYDFNKIRENGSCIIFAQQVLGAPVIGGRCAAVWRGGERDSVAITKESWYDHAQEVGGGLLELCQIAKFGEISVTTQQQAQEFLGDWLHLPERILKPAPKKTGTFCRYDQLIEDGFTETARYVYTDAAGEEKYFVCRMQHPEKKKEFLQGTKEGWGIKGVEPLLYNLPAVIPCGNIVIVEGEKDVHTLLPLLPAGWTATTNSGGAEKWQESFTEYLKGKKLYIIPDNDEVGYSHAIRIANFLCGMAEIRIIQVSKLPKGDVTDYMEKEGGTIVSFMQKISSAPVYDPAKMGPVEAAKLANKTPFRNYTISTVSGKNGRTREEKEPRSASDMVKDIHTRLLGAPRRIGDVLFDQDRKTGEIRYFYSVSDLFAWLNLKSGHNTDWCRLDNAISKAEFMSTLKQEAEGYNAISNVPDFPQRQDVYYTCRDLPEPSEGYSCFWNFINFFSPADDVSRSLIAAFMIAPLFALPGASKPLWIIDSVDGQGSGKSTVPEMCARLYNSEGGGIINTTFYEMRHQYTELVKRILSPQGRNSRILLIDNVTGDVKCDTLARLVTAESISGRPAYGQGEESRPNNLSYVVTLNAASVDTDTATRAFYIMMKRPEYSASWRRDIYEYIEKNRLQIFADMRGMMQQEFPVSTPPKTRFPEFESRVLIPVCGTEGQYSRVLAYLTEKKEETNEDDDIAQRLKELICEKLRNVSGLYERAFLDPDRERIFIRSTVIDEWLRNLPYLGGRQPVRVLRSLGQCGRLPVGMIRKWPHNPKPGHKRVTGIMWEGSEEETEYVRMVDLNEKGVCIEVEEGRYV